MPSTTSENLFRFGVLARAIEDWAPLVVDVGARAGADTDLAAAAWATTVIGFEPDARECEALTARMAAAPGPWRSVRFLPTAIAGQAGDATLWIPGSPAGASLLRHNDTLVSLFGYEGLHHSVSKATVRTMTLDQALEHEARDLDFLKIDVEGAELAILEGAARTLPRCSAIKVEVSFLEQRLTQPLIWQVGAYLGRAGFLAADMTETHAWRSSPVPAHPYSWAGPISYSRGMLAQTDILFLRDLGTQASEEQGIRLLFTSAVLGFFDYALKVVERSPGIRRRLLEQYGAALFSDLAVASRKLGRLTARREMRMRLRSFVPLLRSITGGIRVRAGSP